MSRPLQPPRLVWCVVNGFGVAIRVYPTRLTARTSQERCGDRDRTRVVPFERRGKR